MQSISSKGPTWHHEAHEPMSPWRRITPLHFDCRSALQALSSSNGCFGGTRTNSQDQTGDSLSHSLSILHIYNIIRNLIRLSAEKLVEIKFEKSYIFWCLGLRKTSNILNLSQIILQNLDDSRVSECAFSW